MLKSVFLSLSVMESAKALLAVAFAIAEEKVDDEAAKDEAVAEAIDDEDAEEVVPKEFMANCGFSEFIELKFPK